MGVFYLSYYSKIKLTSFFFFLVAFTFQFFIKKHKGQEIKMGVLYLSCFFGCPLSFVAFTFQFFTKKHKGQEINMGALYLFGCPLSFSNEISLKGQGKMGDKNGCPLSLDKMGVLLLFFFWVSFIFFFIFFLSFFYLFFQFFIKKHKGQEIKMCVLYLFIFWR